ncbi:MAG: nucleotidyl transferase AbiEii/AbiGii toxin family protein [Hyphomicrobiales bacterium]|nr:nucleotidyl transferase AbiEii/AbiGii toxin family protein [Hyphomicrobiales bacterium]MCY4038578.1 nucleotidyl transferase AbiEii/AbiGii toxin family protein [Hyphomicrobiales bacterium]
MDDDYINQVQLLIQLLPYIAKEEVFALKGGTAINLFHLDMPRLSVDIDLTYMPIADRESSLRDVDEAFDRIMEDIEDVGCVSVGRSFDSAGNKTGISVSKGIVRIKIETSPVLRGTVLPPRTMATCNAVTERFGFARMRVLSFEDLYAGKIHAALDRQHPRDLFDIKALYENEGLTNDLFRVFMVYVASSHRPMHELLNPSVSLSEELLNRELVGMTHGSMSKKTLDETGAYLLADIQKRLTGDIANFLLSLHDGNPDFELIELPEARHLPAVRWKLLNLKKLKTENINKHMDQRKALEALFQ